MIKFVVFIILLVLGLYFLFVDISSVNVVYNAKIKYNTNKAKRKLLKAIHDNDRYIMATISSDVDMEEIYEFISYYNLKNVKVNILDKEIIITAEVLNNEKKY